MKNYRDMEMKRVFCHVRSSLFLYAGGVRIINDTPENLHSSISAIIHSTGSLRTKALEQGINTDVGTII